MSKKKKITAKWPILVPVALVLGAFGLWNVQDVNEPTETSSAVVSTADSSRTTTDVTEKVITTASETAKTTASSGIIVTSESSQTAKTTASTQTTTVKAFSLDEVPAYTDAPYAVVNDNTPFFTEGDMTDESYETYSALDSLKRCGAAMACVGTDLMPTEERGSISQIRPSGWHSVQYDFVDGKSLYNRCHLIGFQLSGENANECNLITGTRYMNVTGMLPFENMVADYVKETENHVLYRVTPIFVGDELVARGVLMEAKSVEDDGEGILFNVFCYNVQPGVEIDYETGDSKEATAAEGEEHTYILNTGSKKFHTPDCSSAKTISDAKRQEYVGTRELLILQGYTPCGICKP